MGIEVKGYLKNSVCWVWDFSLGQCRTHCVSQTILSPLQSFCSSLPSSEMTGIGHHAQLEHPQIFIFTNSLLTPWKTVCVWSALWFWGCMHLVKVQGCMATSHLTPRETASLHSAWIQVSPHPHQGLCWSLLGACQHSGSEVIWTGPYWCPCLPCASSLAMCLFERCLFTSVGLWILAVLPFSITLCSHASQGCLVLELPLQLK